MKPDIHRRRRDRFFTRMGEGVALLFAPPPQALGWDLHYRYRPDPDLLYLTGFTEPETVAVLEADRRRLTLFVRPKDRERETWEGRRAGPEGARREFGADAAFPISELPKRLPGLIRRHAVLYHALGQNEAADRQLAGWIDRFRREARHPKRGPVVVKDPTEILHEMRLVKEPAEVEAMERSAAIAARAHRDAMAAAAPGRYEYELAAALERRFVKEGASGPAYPSIVASGVNATILHYDENRRRIAAGDLVLVDAGCEVDGYASDITRTFPASGRFSRPQRRLYDAVLAAQTAAIAKAVPGARYTEVHDAAREVLLDALLDLGLLRGPRAVLKKKNAAQRFCLHNTSHWLGLDVHDRGRYVDGRGTSRALAAGMVLTVEPGLYVRPDERNVPAEYLGLGVRIEDDVLVTAAGPRVLTAGAPKEPEELLAAVGRRRA
ncbi:MAG TPA: aminopeptidase P N-terminal domain-containing protein [Thermoanaerobaculia bacterium]|nr:aminopeptidase P N-terminal domain-containing protein [Thermoanaerobaculia bacterium]HQR67572.1 aminopeptidase P N-terminal domain-containing protein [Thermoanaerobaculia bacterium]